MAKMEKTRWVLHALLYVLLIAAILSSGCLSKPMDKVGNIFNPSSVKLFQEENYYQIGADELTTPVIPVQAVSIYESKPDELSNNLPVLRFQVTISTQNFTKEARALSVCM